MNSFLQDQIEESIKVKKRLLNNKELTNNIENACKICFNCYLESHKLLIAGNGGSAADSQHIAGELVSKFYFDRPALPALALTTDTSILTAIGNDYGYQYLFSRQIEGNGNRGDVFLAISTSGNSKNLIKAIEVSKNKGIAVIGLTGENGGKMGELCDVILKIPSQETPRIQECHILIGHLICSHIEKEVFKSYKTL
jgi:D-sedoheptulose 7-phosphate isomerase